MFLSLELRVQDFGFAGAQRFLALKRAGIGDLGLWIKLQTLPADSPLHGSFRK